MAVVPPLASQQRPDPAAMWLIFQRFLIFRNCVDAGPKSVAFIRRPVPEEGRCATSRNAGRDAVDASGAQDEGAFLRTEKTCGPDTPTLVSSWRNNSAGDGGQKARSTGESTE